MGMAAYQPDVSTGVNIKAGWCHDVRVLCHQCQLNAWILKHDLRGKIRWWVSETVACKPRQKKQRQCADSKPHWGLDLITCAWTRHTDFWKQHHREGLPIFALNDCFFGD